MYLDVSEMWLFVWLKWQVAREVPESLDESSPSEFQGRSFPQANQPEDDRRDFIRKWSTDENVLPRG